MADLYSQIKHLHPCFDAVEWLGDRTLEEAWTECEHGDRMLWLAEKIGVERKLIVLAACECVEPALEFAEGDEAETAIRTARLWCDGKATLGEVRAASDAAYDASVKAALSADDAAYAADEAAYAAANAAAFIALAAARVAADANADAAVDAAALAAFAAVGDGAYVASLKHSAELVRARIPVEVWRETLEGEQR